MDNSDSGGTWIDLQPGEQFASQKSSNLAIKVFAIAVVLIGIGIVVYWTVFAPSSTSAPPSSSSSSPPPSPPLAPQVFGVEMKDFAQLFDSTVRVQSDGSLLFQDKPLTGNRITVRLLSPYQLATVDQVRVAAMAGMQMSKWGLAQAGNSTNLVGCYPANSNLNIVTSPPPDMPYPNVLWIYGPKPPTFRMLNDITDRAVY